MVKRFGIIFCVLIAPLHVAWAADVSGTSVTAAYDTDILPLSVFRKLDISGGECYARVTSPEAKAIWQQVICENDVTPSFLKWVQERLAASGQFLEVPHKRGEEAELDTALYVAIEAFQADINISRGGLTFETMNALNAVKLK